MEKFYKKGHLEKHGKRWLALLMSVCLIGTMIPVTARAETAENIGTDETLTQTEGKLITTWQWIDEDEYLDEETGSLALPGASEQTPAYFDDVISFLPTQIQATVENTEDTEAEAANEAITLGDWECDNYPVDGAYSGSYTFTATLPEGYALSGEAEALTVLVELGGATVWSEESDITYRTCDSNGQNWTTKTCASATLVTASDTSWGTSGNETWYVVNGTMTIDGRVTVNGDVHLILCDDCSLTVNGGIQLKSGNSLTIYGQTEGDGYLYANAKSEKYCPGIGAWTTYMGDSGKIIINGGTIQATGGAGGAGIGSAAQGISEIIINGGTITAYGGSGGAGIGGGLGVSAGSTITINGGSISAYGGSACNKNGAAGIGGGESDSGGTIIINGGTIYSKGGAGGNYQNAAAGIGAGGGNDDGELTINGGTITAIGGVLSGYNGVDGDGVHIKKLHITNGNLTATGYYGIYFAESTTITENSSVNVTGATAIYGASGATFSVNNGSTVTAYARTMYGILCNGSITISGSTVTAVGKTQGIKSETAVNITDNSNVFANGIDPKDNSSEWNGFIVSKNVGAGKLAFDDPQQVLNGDYTMAGTLLIPDGTILTNKGTLNVDIIEVEGSGQLVNEGTLNANKIIMPTTGEVCNKAGGTMNVQLIEYQQEFGKLTNSGDMYVKTLNAAYILNGTMTNDGRIFIGGGFSRANEVLGNGGIYYQLNLVDCSVILEGTDSDALIEISEGKYYAKWSSKIHLKPDWNDNQFFKEWYAPNVFFDDESYDSEDMTIQKTNIFTMPNWPATITAKYSTLSMADRIIEYGPYATNRYPLVVSGIYDGSGMGTVTYKWYKGQNTNGEPLEETRGSYTTPVDLEVGEHFYTCEIVCDGGENRRNTVTLTAKVTVVQSQGKVTITTDSLDKTYDGQGVAAPVYEVQGDGAVTVEYARKDESNFSTTVPVDVGEYVVRVSLAETNHYKAATDTLDFTITPASLTIVDLTATNRGYEAGNTTVALSGGTLSGIISGDEGQVTAQMPISGTMEDDNIGNEKTVTYSTTLTGDKANNYTLTLPTVTVNIVKAESSVTTTPSAKTLVYNGAAQELVTAGSGVTGGTLQYSTSRNGTYSANIPTGTDATDYSVWYKVVGDANHNDTEPVEIKVTIAPLEITNENTTITPGAALTYTGEEQIQSIESVKVGDMILATKDYVVTGNKGTDAGLYTLTVMGTGNVTGTATIQFSISKKSVTGTNQTLLVKTSSAKDITYDLGKLLPAGVTGTTTYVVSTEKNENGVLSPAPTVEDISGGKLTLHVASVASAEQTATIRITFTNSNYDISDATLTVKTTDKLPVTLSGVTCGNRVYNGTAYTYTGTPVWMTEDGTAVTGDTTVAYYKVVDYSADVIAYLPLDAAPTDAGSYQAKFTITSDDYMGTVTYSFEITKAVITVAAKNKSIYVGDEVPSLENPVAGTDYTVTGLCGTDALSGTVSMSYAEEPDNTKAGTYEIQIQISGLTAPAGGNYTITSTNGTLTITTKPSGGGSTGGSSDSGSSSGGSFGGAAGGATDKPADSDNTTTTTNKDGSTTTTTTETDANGNTVTTTTTVATDGSTTEKVQTTDTNAAGKEVAVTTTTKTDADGNVTGVTEKSVIDNIAKDTTATVTVKTDGDGNVTSAKASVTKTSDTGTVSLGSKVLGQITEAAGADTEVRVTMTVKDSEGNTKYKVQADTKEIIPGERLYIYKLNTATGKYTMVNAKEYKVTKAGSVTVNMTKKATYELVTAKESKAITKEILATVKPAKSSTSLSEDKKTTFKLSAKLDMDNVKSITYTTSKKSIATVSKKGTITAVNTGNATVMATVTLKNGTKKTIKMTIRVN